MILDQFRLDNKVALITGTHKGLGQAIAIALAEAGADIVALDRSEPLETRAAVAALGRRFFWLPADLVRTTPADLRALVDEADWDDVLQVNLKALFFLSQAAARVMVQQGGGKIINIASMLSFQGGIRILSYTAAKSGVAGVTRALANEWARHNINVNAIAPGYMATDNTAPLRADPDRNQTILDRIPAGHWGQPEDLQGAVVFLASAASDYVHGAILPVDGGWLAR
jgi:2-deoxy-D-gluconate 3-dehydrogenase